MKKILSIYNQIISQPKYLLVLITVLALFLRVFRLSQSPPRLTHDEMSLGYNAYSILKTGRDEWSRLLPLDFEAFGDHKLPGYIYSTVPLVALLGLSVLTVKLPSILAGTGLVIIGYLLAKLVTKNEAIGLVTAVVIAINPWPVHISRMALESNLALMVFGLGCWLWLKSQQQTKSSSQFAILAGLSWAATFYTYVAYRLILIVVWGLILILTKLYRRSFKLVALSLATFLIVISPLAFHIFSPGGTARFSQISIFTDPGYQLKVNEMRNFCFLSQPRILPKLCRLFFSTPQQISNSFLSNYLKFLLPSFLFLEGDSLEYLNNQEQAEFFLILLPFYLLGIFSWLQNRDYAKNLLFGLFLISPVPAALAGEPQIVRGSALILFISLFIAQGINYFYQHFLPSKLIKKGFVLGLAGLLALSLISFSLSQYYIYPAQLANYLYPLNPQALNKVKELENDYQSVYFHETFPDAHIMLAFSYQLDPSWYQSQVVRPEPDEFGFSHPIELGKYQFGDKDITVFVCDPELPQVLYVSNHVDDKKFVVTDFVKDFSGVHTEVQFFDVQKLRQDLINKKLLGPICPNVPIE